ncbi:MAG: CBS domain-containing protein, partial [Oligoflexia bacterium]|nr:CBS domain-containing protein [Oligoflexia bacterium]
VSFEDVIKTLPLFNHSRYPVCNGDLDKTVGFLHVKDLLSLRESDRSKFSLQKYLKNPFFVYEHMKIQVVFDHMNRKKVHLALVKDENGLVVGIVTLEDIIEEILGEINDEHDFDTISAVVGLGGGGGGSGSSGIATGTAGSGVSGSSGGGDFVANGVGGAASVGGILVEGGLLLRDLYNDYDIKIPPSDSYSTLAGFLLDMLGNNFPKKGMMVFWEGLSFKLEEVVDFEIKKVRINDVGNEKHLFLKHS